MPLAEPGKAAKDVAPADDQGHFNAHFQHRAHFTADGGHGFGINAVFLLPGQGFTAQLEQNALVLECGHGVRLGKSR